jgi:hypothetical protein
MSNDPVDFLKAVKRAEKMIRKGVAAEIEAAWLVAEGVKKFGPDGFREKLGDAAFDKSMAIARRREELGEEQLKLVLFRERRAEIFMAPDQN